MIAQIWCK